MKALLLALAAALTAGGAQPETLRFVTCPIYRDTDAGKKSGCWLVDERVSGRRFDVSRSPTKPDWNHEVLIEGRVSGTKSNCGGELLDPVRASVLPGNCTRHMLPPEDFAGNRFVLPVRNVRPVSEVRPAPKPPFADRTFYIPFDFNSSFIVYQLSDYLFDEAVSYIRGVNPARVIVTGWAATEPADVSGRQLAEDGAIARTRTELIAESLVRLGIPQEKIETRWRIGARPVDMDGADGLPEPSRRRVDIEVKL